MSAPKVHSRDWRGQLFSDGVFHRGAELVSVWLEVFDLNGRMVWTSDLEHALVDARLVLEKEPFLSCRLVGASVDVIEPELSLVLTQLKQREIRYRHYREQLMAGAFGEFDQRDMRQGAGSRPDACKGLCIYPKRRHEGFVRMEIALGFVDAQKLVDAGIHGEHFA